MATVTITAPNGKTVTIEGDRVPSESEIRDIFAHAGIETPAAAPAADLSKMPSMAPVASHGGPAQPTESIFARLGHAITSAHAQQAATLAHPDIVTGQAAVLPELATGAGKGALSTVVHGGDIVRRTAGLPRIINEPDVMTAITPTSPLQKVGFGTEQAAEFMAPVSKVAGASRGLSLGTRLLREAGTGALVAGTQSGGDPAAMVTAAGMSVALPFAGQVVTAARNVVGRAAAGAAEGGFGGAVASAVRESVPVKPRSMLVQALKPRATNAGFESALDRAMPEIKATADTVGRPIASIDDLLAATKLAKRRIWSQYEQMAGPARAVGTTIDTTPVADAIVESIPKKVRLENPAAAAKLETLAHTYRQRMPIQDVEQLLLETNAELDSFYAKYPHAQRSALAANPEVAHTVATGRELRKALYNALDADGEGAAARELKQRYGALSSVEEEVYRRSNVAKRQQPESLSEQIGKVRAARDMAMGIWRLGHGDLTGAADIAGARAGRQMSTYLKEQQTTDALIRRAFAGYDVQPTPVPMPTRPPVRGLLERGPLVTPAPADGSFVRSVPAEVARRDVRGLLPAGAPPAPVEPPRRVFHLGGDVQPDPSRVGSVPAAPLDYEIDPTVTVKAGGFRVKQFAGDPQAAAAAVANTDVRQMLRRMRDDLGVFTPQRGRLVNDFKYDGQGSESHYAPGSAGSPVGDDIREISEQHVGNDEITQAINDLLKGKKPTNRLHTAALDAAMGYLEKRPGYRGPSVPAELSDVGSEAQTIDVTPAKPQSTNGVDKAELLRRAKSLRALAEREISPRKSREWLKQAQGMEQRAKALGKGR